MVCSNGLPAISEDEDEDVEAAKVAVLCPLLLLVSHGCRSKRIEHRSIFQCGAYHTSVFCLGPSNRERTPARPFHA